MTASDASPETAAAAEAGPHAGWSTFDSKLEGSRFHLLHGAVSASEFDAAAAARLAAELDELAQSYGYGTADGYLTDAAGLTAEEVEANPQLGALREAIFGDPDEHDPYFHEVLTSERLLSKAAVTAEARAFLGFDGGAALGTGTLQQRMLAAFERGRDMRAEQDLSPPPSP